MSVEKKKAGKLPCGRAVPDWLESKYSSKEKRLVSLQKKLDLYVALHKLNQSGSRKKILEVIANFESHFTAGQLIASVAQSFSSIGSATVYRSVQVFNEAGILRETFSTDSGEKVYEVESTKHHDHIVCLDCDAILEFHEVGIETLQEKVLKRLGFTEARHRHVIYAHCNFKSVQN